MPAIRLSCPSQYHSLAAGLLITTLLIAGCATYSAVPSDDAKPQAQAAEMPDRWIPVTRYGRYTLVELTPEASQQDLLLQVIDVSMPAQSTTVGDALRYVLQDSGYALCDADRGDIETLYGLPLPAAHSQLGPLFLHDALQTLAGSAWKLQVDGIARRVCFSHEAEVLP